MHTDGGQSPRRVAAPADVGCCNSWSVSDRLTATLLARRQLAPNGFPTEGETRETRTNPLQIDTKPAPVLEPWALTTSDSPSMLPRPGCGVDTAEVLRAAGRCAGSQVIGVAPTGRAARGLREVTSVPTGTRDARGPPQQWRAFRPAPLWCSTRRAWRVRGRPCASCSGPHRRREDHRRRGTRPARLRPDGGWPAALTGRLERASERRDHRDDQDREQRLHDPELPVAGNVCRSTGG